MFLNLKYITNRILILIILLLISCSNENEEVFNGIFSKNGSLATILTTPATSVTDTSAEAGGNLTDNGSTYIIARGICWSTDQNPDTSDFTIDTGKETGEFACSIPGLSKGTVYYMRAYVSNNIGTAYGNQETFTTLNIPTITTASISNITDSTAVSGGNITADGGVNVTARGVCLSTKQNPTIADTISKDGSGKGIFTSSLKRLVPNTTYYVKAWATNSVGTAYGNELTFTTTSPVLLPPSITTTVITAITQTTAVSGGTIISDGGTKIIARGLCWSTSPNPVVTNYHSNGDTISGNPSSFSNLITGLTANTTYYVRAFATNSIGTAYGNELSFTTSVAVTVIPSISTIAISSVTQITATSGGNISNDGGANVITRGVCWSTFPNPTISLTTKTSDGTGTGTFSSSITGLAPGTLYYVKAYATNSAGTAYGNEISFTTLPASGGTVTDIDGNVYNTVVIGTQTWMKENLKTTTFRDGISIPLITDNSSWSSQTKGAYCWYNNSVTFKGSPYGALYNYFTTVEYHNLCPTGWHVPTDAEWNTLVTYLGGESVAGGKLKESGTMYWNDPNTGADNSSLFSGVGSGIRSDNGQFVDMGTFTSFWSSDEFAPSSTGAWRRYLSTNNTSFIRQTEGKADGLSVRCLKGEGVLLPIINTLDVSNITQTSASIGGSVPGDMGSPITQRGICYNTSPNPTIANTMLTATGTTGIFTSSITGLTANTLYYARAFATNSVGTAYGIEISFKTMPVFSGTVTDIDGNVYNTIAIGTQNWMAENLKTTKYRDGSSIANITDNASWVAAPTTGAYCWYNNDQATYKSTYGALYNYITVIDNRNLCPTGWHVPSDVEWTTLTTFIGDVSMAGGKLKETGTTHWITPNTGATNETGFTALPGGSRHYSGTFFGIGSYVYYWSSTEFSATNAWYRAMANDLINVTSNYFSKQYGFSVRCLQGEGQFLPSLTTTATTAITSTTATSGGNISSDGGATVTARGVCWGTTTSPTIVNSKTADGTGTGTFSSSITGLTPGTLYYVRAYATNSAGTAYGNEISFTTLPLVGSTVTDIDGNVYNIITIGTQTWLKENLKTTKFRDGTAIAYGSDPATWNAYSNLNSADYCWYNDDINNKNIYGALYNFHSVIDGHKLCPTGWHVPANAEWTVLENYVGGSSIGGGKLKESGTSHWLTPNTGATDEYGYSALPGGYRSSTGGFTGIGNGGYYWSSTENPVSICYGRYLSYMSVLIETAPAVGPRGTGFSVRCLQGEPVPLAIGDCYQGGIIAYIFQSGDPGYVSGQTHGLIAAPTDQGTLTQWGCRGTLISGADGIAIGTGKQNTIDIVTGCTTSGIAAKTCYDLILNGYDDWYLPSKEELYKMFLNRVGIGNFLNASYWSSSEDDSDFVWYLPFNEGSYFRSSKDNGAYVRAIRSF